MYFVVQTKGLAVDIEGKNQIWNVTCMPFELCRSQFVVHINRDTSQTSRYSAGVNMGYMENSYTNSNNGGSVNSQDSLWQMKMAAAGNNGVNMAPPHQMVDRQSNYCYDPMTHGGYGALDEYAAYPTLTGHARADYCSDPYASVHKPKKRLDQHIGQ